jgi:hypothetical protein
MLKKLIDSFKEWWYWNVDGIMFVSKSKRVSILIDKYNNSRRNVWLRK